MQNKLQEYLKNFFYLNYKKYKKIHKRDYKKFYSNVLITLTNELNKIHKLNLTKKQWAIIVGPWLDNILNMYYFYKINLKKLDNFKLIKQLKYKSFKESKKFQNSFFIYNDFVKNYNSDELHYSIINIIINKNNFRFPEIKHVFFHKRWSMKIIYLKLIKFFFSNRITLHSKSRLTFLDQISLIFASRFKILPLPVMEDVIKFQFTNNGQNRKIIINNIDKKIKNYDVLKFLLFFIPSAYLENFKYIKEIGNKNLIAPKKFYTDSTHLFDEVLKIQLSQWSENKFTKIIIGQHGGNTKIYEDTLLNYNDFIYCNNFITWGYKKTRSKEVCLPSIRLNNFFRKNSKNQFNKKYEVCYILRPIVTNIFSSHFHQNINHNNINEKKKFFKKINKNLILKSYYERDRYKNQITDKALAKLFDIRNEQIDNNFKIVFESKIIIFDYVSTMIFEIINLNKPIILILNKKDQYLSNYGEEFLRNLEKLGMLFPSHDDLIKLLEKNPNYFGKYVKEWNSISKQKKIKKFCKNYAFISKNFLNNWKNYLIK